MELGFLKILSELQCFFFYHEVTLFSEDHHQRCIHIYIEIVLLLNDLVSNTSALLREAVARGQVLCLLALPACSL